MSAFTRPLIPTRAVGRMGTMAVTGWDCLLDCLLTTVVGPAGAAWPAASRALFLPFEVWSPAIFNRGAVNNTATISGNLDIGIYDAAGTRLVSSGSTAHAGANSVQEVDFADTALGPGCYYMALAFDNGTATLNRWNVVSTQWMIACGIQQMAAAFPLPSTATFANPAAAYVPSMLLTMRGVT